MNEWISDCYTVSPLNPPELGNLAGRFPSELGGKGGKTIPGFSNAFPVLLQYTITSKRDESTVEIIIEAI